MTSALRKRSKYSPQVQRWFYWAVTVGSILLCLLIAPTRFPGMSILGVSPNWMLIWVVAWSIKRTPFQSAIAGLVVGLIQDGMTAHHPTHTLSLIVVGVLTARLQKQRYIEEDIISVALIVFAMSVVAETILALQISLDVLVNANSLYPPLPQIWIYHQRVALSSAIISSLWAPALCYPLSTLWAKFTPPEIV